MKKDNDAPFNVTVDHDFINDLKVFVIKYNDVIYGIFSHQYLKTAQPRNIAGTLTKVLNDCYELSLKNIWVDVNDRLPQVKEGKQEVYVLVKNDRNKIEVARYFIDRDEYFFMASNGNYQYAGVTHWMPLPGLL